jgi:hypothetical protein
MVELEDGSSEKIQTFQIIDSLREKCLDTHFQLECVKDGIRDGSIQGSYSIDKRHAGFCKISQFRLILEEITFEEHFYSIEIFDRDLSTGEEFASCVDMQCRVTYLPHSLEGIVSDPELDDTTNINQLLTLQTILDGFVAIKTPAPIMCLFL